MEETAAYIESGILELYVLGQLNLDEQQEVERMSAKFPEVKKEIMAIELAMENYAKANAIEPAVHLEDRIIAALQHAEVPVSTHEATIIPLNPSVSSGKIRTLQYALVACIALLLVSTAALYSAHSQLGDAKNQIAQLSIDRDKFVSNANFMEQKNGELSKIADMVANPSWSVVKLAGTASTPSSKMMVYWNKDEKSVWVDNSKMTLPANDTDHQYQLWALVNGKPVDLGVFDMKTDQQHILLKMKEIPMAQAFAVTLEKRGGSVSPTMSNMMVVGNVTI
ncbi:MAG: anti-sigma factor [Pedobacter sp.]|nr:MAG: anti-sigma factor [Pedobacter sp.]